MRLNIHSAPEEDFTARKVYRQSPASREEVVARKGAAIAADDVDTGAMTRKVLH